MSEKSVDVRTTLIGKLFVSRWYPNESDIIVIVPLERTLIQLEHCFLEYDGLFYSDL